MRDETPETGASTPEARLHLCVLFALGIAAGSVLLSRDPVAAHRAPAGHGQDSRSSEEVTRPALERAIAELARRFERSRGEARTPLEVNLELLAMGRAALEPPEGPQAALVYRQLEALVAGAPAQLASLPVDGAGGLATGDARVTLSILLEAGSDLDRELPLPSGARTLRQLLESALPAVAEHPSSDPWRLDLLSFAVLGGKQEQRAALARAALASLTRLEHEQRALLALQGGGAPSEASIEGLARELGLSARQRAEELSLSTALFRAVAVLGDTELEQRARRHVNLLLFRWQLEREARGRLLARAQSEAARLAIHLSAVEALGRLEQALYGAQLALRGDRSGPAPRTATTMRRAAHDLITHLEALRRGKVFDEGHASALSPEQVTLAAAHALRGLRVARVAT